MTTMDHYPSASSRRWKSAIVYQICPASFFSTDALGTGDIRGITRSLDYIRSLGATALWLSDVRLPASGHG